MAEESNIKQCPFCAETIKAEASVCRYCRRDLAPIKSPEKKKSSGCWWLVILVMIVIIGFFYLLVQSGSSVPSYREPARPSFYTVIYEVTGERGADLASVTYENSQGGTEQAQVRLPYRNSFVFTVGSFAYISAQNERDRGQITCRIYVDDVKWKESTSSGAYTIASCSGSVGRE